MISRLAYKLSFICIAAGVIGIYDISSTMRQDKEYDNFAKTALAEPATTAVPGTTYQGDLEYQTWDGKSVLISAKRVPLEVRDRIGALKSVEIQYVPGKTDEVRFSQWQNKRYGTSDMLVAIGIFIAGCAAMYLLRKKRD